MKDDAPVPDEIPRKRRQVENALDKWIAVWLARDDLAPSDRKRLEAEKARRKALNPDPVIVGLLIGQEGVTPGQLDALRTVMLDYEPEAVIAPCTVKLGLPPNTFVMQTDGRAIVVAATVCFAMPAQTYEPEQKVHGVWPEVRYARHRKIPVTVVWPDGSLNEGGSA